MNRRRDELPEESPYAEDFQGIALGYISLWQEACNVQINRLLSDDQSLQSQDLIDCVLLVFAADNFREALVRYRDALKTPVDGRVIPPHIHRAARYIVKSIRTMDDSLPNLADLRNVLAHFEAYAFGIGNAQKKARQLAPLVLRHEHREGTYVLEVRNSGAEGGYVFDAQICRGAVHRAGRYVVDAMVETA